MIYLQQKNTFIANGKTDKALRQQLQIEGIDPRRFSRFTQLALLGALPLKNSIQPTCGIYLGSPFNSPSKFDKMFHQLNEYDMPSPLDFMANINNAATFQLAQIFQIMGNSIFLPINQKTIWQPLQLAKLDLINGDIEQALIGWVLEGNLEKQPEGAIFWLVSKESESAVKKLAVLPKCEDMQNLDFLSIVQKI
ncbi:hypothetical protein BKG91_01175 [Rodentibacter caecimuris]|uniref:Uncharacterized protein n=1 Tax=Rodentibacter caecimuris TaxID=1796644 RepID=A0A9X8VZC8_9PAST|nr:MULTISPECIES: hypothetical protein [Pasteurellaceae]AOF52963.1 hypothetical protein AC062_0868 [Pasteurellaceae bacterium NI1060]MCR1837149.1 hypothetical protein [Pasteurella caecimuris]MCU0106841.1 hypothetical protein [Pasteurella caecimuris]OOF71438.1 hypothetical protein BKG90_08385 [Rodentibacter heylii]OOF76202.1 hypothetical protein BKG91_01175 [Rodentibacter heylii]